MVSLLNSTFRGWALVTHSALRGLNERSVSRLLTFAWTRTYIAKHSNCSCQRIGRIPHWQRRVEHAWSPLSVYQDQSDGIARRRYNRVAGAQVIFSRNQRYAATKHHQQAHIGWDENVYLATEPMLIHKSYCVKVNGGCLPLLTYFTDWEEKLRDINI